MAYLVPSEFVTKMVDAGESKIFMSTRDTLIRAYMAGAILALAAWFAITITVNTGQPIIGAILFPVGFCMLYLFGFDLLTGVFVLCPLALDRQAPGRDARRRAAQLGPRVRRQLRRRLHGRRDGGDRHHLRLLDAARQGRRRRSAIIGESRTVGYAAHGAAGMLTLFIRGMLCNWMVSAGVVGAMISTTVPGKVIAMWMPIMLFFSMTFEHSIVNMFLFPSGLLLGGQFTMVRLPVLERDPDRARQPGRRPRLHRADALRHARQDRAEACRSARLI